MFCELCGKQFNGYQGLSNHLGKSHNNYNKKLYYDTYMKQQSEDICKQCGNQTHFQDLTRGYTKYCCRSCQVKAQGNGSKINHTINWQIQNEKINQYEQLHNCIHIKHLIQQKGRIVLVAIDKLQIPIIRLSKMYLYINNKYIQSIDKFIFNYTKSGTSNEEQYLKNHIICNDKILTNYRKIIYPYELDIYIPSLKLAIEFNGNYYHCIDKLQSKTYHLDKSLLCREKGIRLIHIYEFEDLDDQIYKVNELIKGIDLYNQNDFNKNNLNNNIPEPTIIYKTNRYTIYGAGALL